MFHIMYMYYLIFAVQEKEILKKKSKISNTIQLILLISNNITFNQILFEKNKFQVNQKTYLSLNSSFSFLFPVALYNRKGMRSTIFDFPNFMSIENVQVQE